MRWAHRLLHEDFPAPTQRVDDAEVIELAGREWVSLHTPGHTNDHLCLFDPAEGIVRRATTCCPTITPHISGLVGGDDPLDEFFRSSRRSAALEGVELALAPAARATCSSTSAGRAKEIRDHHEERLDMLRRRGGRARHRHGRGLHEARSSSRAFVGSDGRQRDLRPPRAPPGDRRGRGALRARRAPLPARRLAARRQPGTTRAAGGHRSRRPRIHTQRRRRPRARHVQVTDCPGSTAVRCSTVARIAPRRPGIRAGASSTTSQYAALFTCCSTSRSVARKGHGSNTAASGGSGRASRADATVLPTPPRSARRTRSVSRWGRPVRWSTCTHRLVASTLAPALAAELHLPFGVVAPAPRSTTWPAAPRSRYCGKAVDLDHRAPHHSRPGSRGGRHRRCRPPTRPGGSGLTASRRSRPDGRDVPRGAPSAASSKIRPLAGRGGRSVGTGADLIRAFLR